MGNYSLSRKWFFRTQSTPVRCASCLVSGVDSVMTNSFNFDLFIFIKQMGIQNIVRIIFKQSICFDSIEKEKKKKRNNKTQKKGEILSCDNISFYAWEALIYSRGIYNSSHAVHSSEIVYENKKHLLSWPVKFWAFSPVKIIPYSCIQERMRWVEECFEPPLLSYSLGPSWYQTSFMYWLHNPGNYCSRSQGDKITTNDAAHKFEVLMGEEAEGLWKCLHNQRKSLSPFALGCTKASPEWALHSFWNTRWMRIKTSPTCMVWRRCSSNFMVPFHLGQLNQAGRFCFFLGGWQHILAAWHILLLWWYFRNSFLSWWEA